MAQGICEGLGMKIILDDLNIKYEGPIKLFCDNNSAIKHMILQGFKWQMFPPKGSLQLDFKSSMANAFQTYILPKWNSAVILFWAFSSLDDRFLYGRRVRLWMTSSLFMNTEYVPWMVEVVEVGASSLGRVSPKGDGFGDLGIRLLPNFFSFFLYWDGMRLHSKKANLDGGASDDGSKRHIEVWTMVLSKEFWMMVGKDNGGLGSIGMVVKPIGLDGAAPWSTLASNFLLVLFIKNSLISIGRMAYSWLKKPKVLEEGFEREIWVSDLEKPKVSYKQRRKKAKSFEDEEMKYPNFLGSFWVSDAYMGSHSQEGENEVVSPSLEGPMTRGSLKRIQGEVHQKLLMLKGQEEALCKATEAQRKQAQNATHRTFSASNEFSSTNCYQVSDRNLLARTP
ncbi:hypothetical protein CR513_03252, partial [Mucuna pruriens]